jgi:hypothetical protein
VRPFHPFASGGGRGRIDCGGAPGAADERGFGGGGAERIGPVVGDADGLEGDGGVEGFIAFAGVGGGGADLFFGLGGGGAAVMTLAGAPGSEATSPSFFLTVVSFP